MPVKSFVNLSYFLIR